MNDYSTERRSQGRLSDSEMEAISTRVKEQIMEEIYGEIGKAVFKRAIEVILLIGTAVGAYLAGKGFKLGG